MKNDFTNGAVSAPLGIYVHIPFCIKKCKYCDFISYAACSKEEQSAYVSYLCREIKEKGLLYKDRYYVDTVFFGGGTPTVLEAEALIEILKAIDESFVLGFINSRSCGDGLEISFEANPGTIDKEKLEKLKAAGFNRISIGVQSFDDKILDTLGRIHDSNKAVLAVQTAKAVGFNTNIDLMFGVPGQSLDIWENSLKIAIELNPNHISFYSLQLEEGTPLYNSYRYGDLKLPSWEENRAMYRLALEKLKAAGYIHYEISNAAKMGFLCRHNMKYWSMGEYLGFGTAAHSYIDGKRTGDDEADPKGDFIFTRLRLIQGFPKAEYESRFGIGFDEEFGKAYEALKKDGMLTEESGNIRFTNKGLDFTNPCMKQLLDVINSK